ncbi:hypothetical protein CC86DRAFT_379120 [Ophiobolus disseminans]|uniref:Uncharacterized protein n=1 Tax=Ophiobolus disseminans TaxID=1469910 RepID=A0A6A7AE88_9PLEO|nr:hypothetical protein CC86DRAFT_379120 [Ophiobolus disseminans]
MHMNLKLVQKWDLKSWLSYLIQDVISTRGPRELLLQIALEHRYPTITQKVLFLLQGQDTSDNTAMKKFLGLDFRIVGTQLLHGVVLTMNTGVPAMHAICAHGAHPWPTAENLPLRKENGMLGDEGRWVVGSTVSKWSGHVWAKGTMESIREIELGAWYMHQMKTSVQSFIDIDSQIVRELGATIDQESMLEARPRSAGRYNISKRNRELECTTPKSSQPSALAFGTSVG